MSIFNHDDEQIFKLEVDDTAKAYMLEGARWGKFIAIVGFISIGLMLVVFSIMMIVMSSVGSNMGAVSGGNLPFSTTWIFLLYIIILLISFYPTFSLFKYSQKVKSSINTMNTADFNTAYRHLRNLLKFYGIMIIVGLALYGLTFIVAIFGAVI